MSASLRTLVVVDSDPTVETVQDTLKKGGVAVDCDHATAVPDVAQAVRRKAYDVIIASWPNAQVSPLVLLSVLQEMDSPPPLVVVGEDIPMRDAVSFVQAGVQDVLSVQDLPRLTSSLPGHHRRQERRASGGGCIAVAATVFRSASEAIVVVDPAGVIKAANPATAQLSGYHPEALVGRDFSDLIEPRKSSEALADISAGIGNTGRWQGEVWCRRKDGSEFLAAVSVSCAQDAEQGMGDCVVLLRDVTEHRAYQRRIWQQANFDALTGLPNRAHFFSRLPYVLRLAQKAGQHATVLFVDLDNFKDVNDTLGHAVGDDVLRHVATEIRHSVRDTDLVGRIGGDEFAVVLLSDDGEAAGIGVSGKLLKRLGCPLTLDAQLAVVSVSIGFALAPSDGWDADELLRRADMAMYRAKAQGRNQFCRFDPKRDVIKKRLPAAGRAKRSAVDRRGFALLGRVSQPSTTGAWALPLLAMASLAVIAFAWMILMGGAQPQAGEKRNQIAIDRELLDLMPAAGPSNRPIPSQ